MININISIPLFNNLNFQFVFARESTKVKKEVQFFFVAERRGHNQYFCHLYSPQLLGYHWMCKNNFFSYFHKCGAVWKTSVNEEKTFLESIHCGDVHCAPQAFL